MRKKQHVFKALPICNSKNFLAPTQALRPDDKGEVDVWLHLFFNSALYKGRKQLQAAVGLSPAKFLSVPSVQEAGWAPKIWAVRFGEEENLSLLLAIQPRFLGCSISVTAELFQFMKHQKDTEKRKDIH